MTGEILSEDELGGLVAVMTRAMTPAPGFIASWDRRDAKVLSALLDLQRMRAAAEAVEKLHEPFYLPHSALSGDVGCTECTRIADFCDLASFVPHPCDTYKANRGES